MPNIYFTDGNIENGYANSIFISYKYLIEHVINILHLFYNNTGPPRTT